MARPGLNHVAMSVPPGTLTDEFRAEVFRFYNDLLGWTEIESVRRPDRLTIDVGNGGYLNVRERDEPMRCSGYEHAGIVVGSGEEADALWSRLQNESLDVHLEPEEQGADGYRVFRFRYLLPLAIEIQYFPS